MLKRITSVDRSLIRGVYLDDWIPDEEELREESQDYKAAA